MTEKEKIENFIKERGIKNLYHFTPISNLKSILEKGILPRETLKEEGIDFKPSDNYRADGYTGHISLSIEYPNYKTLSQKTNNNDIYAIIEVDSSIIIESDDIKCSSSNAASCCGSKVRDINEENFKNMFAEENRDTNLPKEYTTDPQAEILYPAKITTDKIKNVYVRKDEDKQLIPDDIKSEVNTDKTKFDARIDYKRWQKNDE